MTPKVALVGPFHNSELHILSWMSDANQQNYSNLILVVVDDGSTDRTREILQQFSREIRFPFHTVFLDKNVGPSAARNAAIKKSLQLGADLILLMDSDCRFGRDIVQRHVQSQLAHPEFGMVGGAIRGKGFSYIGHCDGFGSWFTATARSPNRLVQKMHLSTTNLSIKTRVFSQIGLFDEDLATGEDVAFCRRAQRAGIPLWFQSDIAIDHLDRNQLAACVQHHFRWGLHSIALSNRGHGGYYQFCQNLRPKWLMLFLIAPFALLNTALCLYQNRRDWRVLWYTPGIFYLKLWNAWGVYQGFLDPTRCLRPATRETSNYRDGKAELKTSVTARA